MKRRDFLKMLGLAAGAAILRLRTGGPEPETFADGGAIDKQDSIMLPSANREVVNVSEATRTDLIVDGPVFGTSRISKAPAKVFVSGEYAEVAQAIIEAQWDCAYDEFGRCIPNT